MSKEAERAHAASSFSWKFMWNSAGWLEAKCASAAAYRKTPKSMTLSGVFDRLAAAPEGAAGGSDGLETAHATHAAHTTHGGHRGSGLVFNDFGHSGFGREEQAGHGGSVLQCSAGHLGGIQHALLNQIAVLASCGVVAEVALAFCNLVDDHAGLVTSVGNDGAQRSFDRAQDQLDASVLVDVVALEAGNSLFGADQCNATARNNAFFHGSTRGVQCVFDACLLFLHFHFGRSADADHGHTACQLGNTLLQLLTVVVRSGFFDLNADLLDAGFDGLGIACTVDDGGGFLGHFNALGLTQLVERDCLEPRAGFFGKEGSTGEDHDSFEHCLPTVAEARSLDGSGLEDATVVVDSQGGQGFALDVCSNDQQRTAGLGTLFQDRQGIANVAHLLAVDQDE